ncbi:hypothetical protein SEPCBS119000_005899 [Sporothrix epigloea]|uniref:Chromosome segregation protein n=1 Tax=Sporothrix epigloea TaxID=1892477 RepID=A0ABP0E0F1_9PEZI
MESGDLSAQYYIFENRLASFEGPRLATKRRPSTIAGSRATKAQIWPHKSPAPFDLARAGFFFNPQPSNPDNVRCFLCHKDLDGWEEDDNPLQEHLKHSGSCGWAICAAIELELGDVANEDPRLPYLLDARKSTFADRWPHEGRKGWKCTTKQLADAGWKYTPTTESNDNTTCVYCQLALDGWEATDKPMNEHQRRSPNCPFFTMINQNPPPKKAARGKSSRTSKATRLSVQSTATVQSDTQSLADPDESVLTVATVVTAGGRKPSASRSRKTAAGASTAKSRKTRAKKDEQLLVAEETVDNDPAREEGKLAVSKSQKSVPALARGKKRTSQEAGSSSASLSDPHVTKKKRMTNTRASNSLMQANGSDYAMFDPASPASDESAIEAELRALEKDMEDGRELELQEQIEREQELEQKPKAAVKSRKTGSRKVSKQVRKTKETVSDVATEGQQVAQEGPSELTRSSPLPAQHPAVKSRPSPDIQQLKPPTPESISEVSLKAKAKPKAKPKTRKISLPPREPTKPRLSLQDLEDLEGPDELHEDSFVSANEDSTHNQEAAKSKRPAVIAPPAKRSHGKLSNELTDTTRSSAASHATDVSGQTTGIQIMTVDLPAPKMRKSGDSNDKSGAVATKVHKSQPENKAKAPISKTKQPHASFAPTVVSHAASPAPTTPRKQLAPVASAKQATLSPSQSPQSSDAENRPPSSRPATTSASKGKRVALTSLHIPAVLAAPSTPGGMKTPVRTGSPSKRSNTIGGLRSGISWSAIDVDTIFGINNESGNDILEKFLRKGTDLSTPEKAMTVEGFIFHNADQAERMLKEGCEAMVSVFEQQGTEAMRVLESLEVQE